MILGVLVGAIGCLAMTYSRMRMHTTIGADAFHVRVREGIGWYHIAIVAKQKGRQRRLSRAYVIG